MRRRAVSAFGDGSTVLLSDRDAAFTLAGRLSRCRRPVTWYPSLEELLKEQSPSSIGVLIIHAQNHPPGVLLANMARLAVTYPGIQKIAVINDPPSLPLAKQLAACGFEFISPHLFPDPEASEPESRDPLVETVDRLLEQSPWVTRPVGESSGIRNQ
jgi:hypothetical protein